LIRPQATAKGYLEIADLLALVNELGGEREALSRAFALEQSEETALRIAKLHMKSGRPDLGRRWLLKHLDRWDSTRVRISLADFNLQSGRRAEAEAHLAAARERAGTNPDNVADLARWHMNNGREDEAESLLRAGLATSNHPRLRMILHHLYTIDKRDAEAEHELEMLRAIPGSEPFLAMAHIHQNRPDLARPIVERWISNGREERESALSTYLLKELRIAPTLEELRAAADRRGAPSDHFFLAARFMNQDRPEEAAPLVAKILAQVDAPEIRRILNDSRPEAGAGPADASESGRTHGPFCPRLESNLREAGALCRAAGAAFYADNTGLENRARQSGPWTCAVAAAREEGFGTIDVMGALDRLTSTAERHRITGTGTHFPLEGYRWAARIAFDALSGKLLDPPEKTASSNGTERIW
jgi:tetratricopeptide (TPR) repeat protein